jgi:hypothetical protein
MYCASGIEKALGSQWWNGDAIWISLQQDQFHHFETGWLAQVPFIPKLLGWITICTEALYPFGIFMNRTKKIWLVAVIGMHFFILLFLGLYLFGALMILLNVSAFGYHCFPELFKSILEKKQESFRSRHMKSGLPSNELFICGHFSGCRCESASVPEWIGIYGVQQALRMHFLVGFSMFTPLLFSNL